MEYIRALNPLFWIALSTVTLMAIGMVVFFWSFSRYPPDPDQQ